MAEPIGALFGWLVLANSMNDIVYGVMFALVGGIMIFISFRELLPTARKHDPDDKYVSWSLFIGMCVMAMSLVMFKF